MSNHRNFIVHVHIFKNAGSSLDGALERNFQDAFVDHREDHLIRTNEEFLKEYLQKHENIQAFSSHSVYFKPRSFDNVNLHPIYMLRHPIERMKSVFSFEKKQPAGDSLGAKMAKQFNFEEYVSWRMQDDVPPTIRNLQTVFLAGANHHANHLDKKFQLALETLDESPLIGVVDRYDESMVVFEEYLRPFFPDIDLSYVRKNVTDTNTELSVEEKANKILMQFDAKMQEKIKEKNKYDLELYERANILLDENIEKIDNFREKLYDFKKRCIIKNGQAFNHENELSITSMIDKVMQKIGNKKKRETNQTYSDKLVFGLKNFVDSSDYTPTSLVNYIKKLINSNDIYDIIIFISHYLQKRFLTNLQKNKVLVPFLDEKLNGVFRLDENTIDLIKNYFEKVKVKNLDKYYIYLILYHFGDNQKNIQNLINFLSSNSSISTLNSICITNEYLKDSQKSARPFLSVHTSKKFLELSNVTQECKEIIKSSLKEYKNDYLNNKLIQNIVFIEQQLPPLVTNTGTKLIFDYVFALLDDNKELQVKLLITGDDSNKEFYSLGSFQANKIDIENYVKIKKFDPILLERLEIVYLYELFDTDEGYLQSITEYMIKINSDVLITTQYKEFPLIDALHNVFPIIYFSVLSGLEPKFKAHASIFPGKQNKFFSNRIGRLFESTYIYFNKNELISNQKSKEKINFLSIAVDLPLRLDEEDLKEFLELMLYFLKKGYEWCLLGVKKDQIDRLVSLNKNIKTYIESKQCNIVAYENNFENFIQKYAVLVQPKIIGGGRGVAIAVKNGLPSFVYVNGDAANFLPNDFLYSTTESLLKSLQKLLDKRENYINAHHDSIEIFTKEYNKECLKYFYNAIYESQDRLLIKLDMDAKSN